MKRVSVKVESNITGTTKRRKWAKGFLPSNLRSNLQSMPARINAPFAAKELDGAPFPSPMSVQSGQTQVIPSPPKSIEMIQPPSLQSSDVPQSPPAPQVDEVRQSPPSSQAAPALSGATNGTIGSVNDWSSVNQAYKDEKSVHDNGAFYSHSSQAKSLRMEGLQFQQAAECAVPPIAYDGLKSAIEIFGLVFLSMFALFKLLRALSLPKHY